MIGPHVGLFAGHRALAVAGANLLASPRDFANAIWVTGGAAATVTGNAAAGYDGAMLADRLSDASGAATARRQQAVTVANGALHEASLCLRQDTARYAALEILEGTRRIVVDLETGTLSATGMSLAVVLPLPGGWWRLIGRFTTSSTTATFRVFPAYAASLTQTADVAATGAVYADGASLAPLT